MGVCRFVVSLILTATIWTQLAIGQIAIYPLRDVRAGQHAIGKTVFQGSKIEEFQVDHSGRSGKCGASAVHHSGAALRRAACKKPASCRA